MSLATGATPTFVGDLCNARSVAAAARACGSCVAVVACGEQWPHGDLRPCLEDQIGAGAVIACLDGTPSPEAAAAVAVYENAAPYLPEALRSAASGKELIDWGYEDDVWDSSMTETTIRKALVRGAFDGCLPPRTSHDIALVSIIRTPPSIPSSGSSA